MRLTRPGTSVSIGGSTHTACSLLIKLFTKLWNVRHKPKYIELKLLKYNTKFILIKNENEYTNLLRILAILALD